MGSIEQDYESLAVAQAPKDEVYRFEISHKTVTRTSLILTLLLVAAMGTVAVVDKVHGSSKIGAQDMTSASSLPDVPEAILLDCFGEDWHKRYNSQEECRLKNTIKTLKTSL